MRQQQVYWDFSESWKTLLGEETKASTVSRVGGRGGGELQECVLLWQFIKSVRLCHERRRMSRGKRRQSVHHILTLLKQGRTVQMRRKTASELEKNLTWVVMKAGICVLLPDKPVKPGTSSLSFRAGLNGLFVWKVSTSTKTPEKDECFLSTLQLEVWDGGGAVKHRCWGCEMMLCGRARSLRCSGSQRAPRFFHWLTRRQESPNL